MQVVSTFESPVPRYCSVTGISAFGHTNGSTYLAVLNSQVAGERPSVAANQQQQSSSSSTTPNPSSVSIHRLAKDESTARISSSAHHSEQLGPNFHGLCVSSTFGGEDDYSWLAVGGASSASSSSRHIVQARGGAAPAIWFSPVGAGTKASPSDRVTVASAVIPLVDDASSSDAAASANNNSSNSAATGPVTSIAFLQDADTLVAATASGLFTTASLSRVAADAPPSPIPGLAGSRPTAVEAVDSNSFLVASTRLVARIDKRVGLHSRPAQLWLWHPRDCITALSCDESEIICGTEEGNVLLWDARSPTLVSGGGTPWQCAPRSGKAVAGVGRLSSALGVTISWSDTVLSEANIVACPSVDMRCTHRIISAAGVHTASASSAAAQPVSADGHHQHHHSAGEQAVLYTDDCAVPGMCTLREPCLSVMCTKRGRVSVVSYAR